MRAVLASRFAMALLFQIILLSTVVSAFTFTFSSNATQCSPLTVTVDGGTAPYRLNLIPAGPMPRRLTEIRSIVDVEFSDKKYTVDTLKFPADSQFIAMVSDATGVGTGGTSAILTVSDSKDTTCLPTKTTIVDFFFFLNPEDISLCKPVNISWDHPKGDVTLAGVIPGGQSFQIPVPSGASSVIWQPQIEPNTSIFILAGDSRGRATGGSSAAQTVGQGSRSCLTGGAYSSTQSPFAGQVSATSSPTPTGGSGSKNGISTPLVVGIVAGLLVLFALAGALFYIRRRKRHPTTYGNKTDLFTHDNSSHDGPTRDLEPTPFLSPPTIRGSEHASDPSLFENNGYRYSSSTFHSGGRHGSTAYAPSFNGRPPSSVTGRGAFSPPTNASTSIWDDSLTDTGSHVTSLHDSMPSRPSAGFSVTNSDMGGSVMSGGSRKQPLPRARPVNFLLHQDAGMAEPAAHGGAELIELPPSYADVGRNSMTSPPRDPTAAAPPPQ